MAGSIPMEERKMRLEDTREAAEDIVGTPGTTGGSIVDIVERKDIGAHNPGHQRDVRVLSYSILR